MSLLHVLEAHEPGFWDGGTRCPGQGADFGRQKVRGQDVSRAQGRRLHQHVLQLAHVARPVILRQAVQRLARNVFGLAAPAGVYPGQQGTHQCRQVFHALTQGGQMNRHHLESVEKIFPEGTCGHLFLQAGIGGSDDARIRMHGLPGPERRELLVLQDTEQLGLHRR